MKALNGKSMRSTWALLLAVVLTLLFCHAAFGKERTLTISFRATDAEPDRAFYATVLQRFEGENPGLTVEILPQLSLDALLVQIAAGVAPDMVNISWAHIYNLVRQDVVLPLDKYLYETRWGREIQKKMTPAALEQSRIDGIQYGIPLAAGANVLLYNEDLFTARGLPGPTLQWKWEDLLQYARRITQGEVYGFGRPNGIACWSSMFFSHGGSFYNNDMTEFTFASDAARKAFATVRELVDHGAVAPSSDLPLFVAGRVGMAMANTSWPTTIQEANVLFDWAVAPPPLGDVKRSVPGGNHPLIILKGAKDPDLAWGVIEALTSDQAQLDIVNQGIRLPTNLSIARHIKDPVMRAYAEQLVYQTPYASKYYPEISAIMNRHVGSMVAGTISPQEAIEQIQTQGAATLKELDGRL